MTLPGLDGAVHFTTTPGLRYTLHRSADLLTWENVAPAQVAAGHELTIIDPAPVAEQRFYRVEVAP